MPDDFDLHEWLESRGLGEYAAAFAENQITQAELPHLSDDDLRQLGVTALGHRKRLLAAIAELGSRPAAEPEEAASPSEPPVFDPNQRMKFTLPGVTSEELPPPRHPSIPAPSARSLAGVPAAPHRPVATGAQQVTTAPAAKKPSFAARLLTRKFLLVSLLVHLLFGLGATVFVVQRIQAKRKVTFQGGPPAVTASKRALEHQVSMAKKKKTGGAPPQAKRIVSAGLAQLSLPEMPSIPSASTVVPGMMSGMGGAGFGTGMGFGSGMGSGMGGGTGTGGGMTMFGVRQAGVGLVGYFYDLKQTKDRKPTGMDKIKYSDLVNDFVKRGWHESKLQAFYRSPNPLYARQLLTPQLDAAEGPKAFAVEKEVQPSLWLVHYKGRVSPPESGRYYFVGEGDDILIVRFDNRIVLDRCWEMQVQGRKPLCDSTANYDYGFVNIPNGFARGEPINVIAGQTYPIEILIGEQPGGYFSASLLYEKEGATYQKDGKGNPILPVFRVKRDPPPDGQTVAPHMDDGPIWQAKAEGGSLLDSLRR